MKRHFTIMELVVVMAIFIGIMGTVILMMSSSMRQSLSGQERLEGAGNASFFLRRLRDDFSRALKVECNGGQVVLQVDRGGDRQKVTYTGQDPKVIRVQEGGEDAGEKVVARDNIFNVKFSQLTSVGSGGEGGAPAPGGKVRYQVQFDLVIEFRGTKNVMKKQSIFTPKKMNTSGSSGMWKPNGEVKASLSAEGGGE